MSHFRPVPLEFATRLINHGPTIMVTSRSRDGEKKNIMTAAWSTLVEFDPPRLVVVINKDSYTRELLEESGVFAVWRSCRPFYRYGLRCRKHDWKSGRQICELRY